MELAIRPLFCCEEPNPKQLHQTETDDTEILYHWHGQEVSDPGVQATDSWNEGLKLVLPCECTKGHAEILGDRLEKKHALV